jgi:hypothetical protein
VARRNDRRHDLDNGTLGTIVSLDERSLAMLIRTDTGELRGADAAYAAHHLEHAYALTAHSAQGGTFDWAGVIGRPEEFTREWAYTALSRARAQTTLHVVMERPARERERDEYAPPGPDRDLAESRLALASAMRRTEIQPLAIDQTETIMPELDGPPSTREPPIPIPATPAAVRPRPMRLKGIEALRGQTRSRRGIQARL